MAPSSRPATSPTRSWLRWAMNWRRRLFRIWAALSTLWIAIFVTAAAVIYDEVVFIPEDQFRRFDPSGSYAIQHDNEQWFTIKFYLVVGIVTPIALLMLGLMAMWLIGGFADKRESAR